MDFQKVWERIMGKKNVVGYSASLKRRLKDGKALRDTKVIRIYVSKKEPIEALDPRDVIPRIIDGVETDVVEIGELKAQVGNG